MVVVGWVPGFPGFRSGVGVGWVGFCWPVRRRFSLPCEAARVASAGRDAGRGQVVRPAAARPRSRVAVTKAKFPEIRKCRRIPNVKRDKITNCNSFEILRKLW